MIGYSSGHVDKYNLQSGIHRGSIGDPGKISSRISLVLNVEAAT